MDFFANSVIFFLRTNCLIRLKIVTVFKKKKKKKKKKKSTQKKEFKRAFLETIRLINKIWSVWKIVLIAYVFNAKIFLKLDMRSKNAEGSMNVMQ